MVTKKLTKKPVKKEMKIKCCSWNMKNSCSCGCSYALGFIGAAFYYVSQSTSILGGIIGVIKAAVWPLFLVHALLKFIGA